MKEENLKGGSKGLGPNLYRADLVADRNYYKMIHNVAIQMKKNGLFNDVLGSNKKTKTAQ